MFKYLKNREIGKMSRNIIQERVSMTLRNSRNKLKLKCTSIFINFAHDSPNVIRGGVTQLLKLILISMDYIVIIIQSYDITRLDITRFDTTKNKLN